MKTLIIPTLITLIFVPLQSLCFAHSTALVQTDVQNAVGTEVI